MTDWASQKSGLKRAERKLAELPESETKHGAAVPWPYADRSAYKGKHTNQEINARIKKAPIVRVPLKHLHAIQHSVKPERVDQYLRDPGQKPLGAKHSKAGTPIDHPIVIKEKGRLYIHDGHHRLTADYLQGKRDADARLIDFDAS
jgi:hypothetical protein